MAETAPNTQKVDPSDPNLNEPGGIGPGATSIADGFGGSQPKAPTREEAQSAMQYRMANDPLWSKHVRPDGEPLQAPDQAPDNVVPIQQPEPAKPEAKPSSAMDRVRRLLGKDKPETGTTEPAPQQTQPPPDEDIDTKVARLVAEQMAQLAPQKAQPQTPDQPTPQAGEPTQMDYAKMLTTIKEAPLDIVGTQMFGERWEEIKDVKDYQDMAKWGHKMYEDMMALAMNTSARVDTQLAVSSFDRELSELGFDRNDLKELEQIPEMAWMKGLTGDQKLQALRMTLGIKPGAPAESDPSPAPSSQADINRMRHIDANQGASLNMTPGQADETAYYEAMAAGDHGTAKGIAMQEFKKRWGLRH